ncbi:MAG: hypothetical protein AMXMBFR7_17710 [Planctomycetota bacterium]
MSHDFGHQLRTLREKLKLTQHQVSGMLGCSPPRISEWERGVRTPKPLTQEAILLRLRKKAPTKSRRK